MHIKSVRLMDFQCHKDSTFDLCDGLNAIIGSSDEGKSSVIRAVRWVVENRPLGDDFIRHGAKECRVVVTTSDGHVVQRIRSASGNVNQYVVDGGVLTGFGKGVPDEVTDVLRLTILNMQHQHDGVFLLGESPGEVARKLNDLCDMTAIDTATGKVKKQMVETSSNITQLEKQIEKWEGGLEQLEWLDEAAEAQSAIVKLQTKAENLRNIRYQCENVIGMLETHTITITKLREAVDPDKVREALARIDTLYGRNKDLRRKTIACYRAWEYLSGMVPVVEAAEAILGSKQQLDTIDKFLKKQQEMEVKRKGVDATRRRLALALAGVQDAEQRLADLKAEVGDLPEVCPTCGQEVDWEGVLVK